MTNMQDQIRNRITKSKAQQRKSPRARRPVRKVRRPQQVQAQSVIPEKEKPSFMGIFLGVCILLMAVAIMGGIVVKNSSNLFAQSPAAVVEREVDRSPVYNDSARYGSLDSRLTAVEDGLKKWQHRLWMVVLATNENANLNREIDKTYHGKYAKDYMTLDENWQGSRFPETQSLTDEQREQFRNGPK